MTIKDIKYDIDQEVWFSRLNKPEKGLVSNIGISKYAITYVVQLTDSDNDAQMFYQQHLFPTEEALRKHLFGE